MGVPVLDEPLRRTGYAALVAERAARKELARWLIEEFDVSPHEVREAVEAAMQDELDHRSRTAAG